MFITNINLVYQTVSQNRPSESTKSQKNHCIHSNQQFSATISRFNWLPPKLTATAGTSRWQTNPGPPPLSGTNKMPLAKCCICGKPQPANKGPTHTHADTNKQAHIPDSFWTEEEGFGNWPTEPLLAPLSLSGWQLTKVISQVRFCVQVENRTDATRWQTIDNAHCVSLCVCVCGQLFWSIALGMHPRKWRREIFVWFC